MEYRTLLGAQSGRELTAERIYAALKPFHVVAFATSHEGVFKLDGAWRRRAGAVSQALARYVREGGGLAAPLLTDSVPCPYSPTSTPAETVAGQERSSHVHYASQEGNLL